jgi:hypothetical protein
MLLLGIIFAAQNGHQLAQAFHKQGTILPWPKGISSGLIA